ncbi:MAG: hypothetical protein K7J15_06450, partial [Candidatus Regiella insecticola]|nr:hypothetical protein [Candidatus Regiella insecticola]
MRPVPWLVVGCELSTVRGCSIMRTTKREREREREKERKKTLFEKITVLLLTSFDSNFFVTSPIQAHYVS